MASNRPTPGLAREVSRQVEFHNPVLEEVTKSGAEAVLAPLRPWQTSEQQQALAR